MAPTIYLVSQRLTPEQLDKVKAALAITPLAAVLITDVRDSRIANALCDTVSNLQQPIAIVADFEEPLTAIDENGTLCPVR